MVQPSALDGLPTVLRRLEEYLGFQYITLHRLSSAPGSLDHHEDVAAEVEEPAPIVEGEPEPAGV